ncbi:Transcription factor DUO1 [Sesamum alatum]|uniref:Transcription factor DUO1 n=1 Tax=Sesamum alatum TaxID=300844 RepID=A0AAE2CA16_9LAMI|nr:Transcription factor DUO1 [Sesamum alatum]
MVVEGKRRMAHHNGELKKGPWKAEEDEVLVNHVKRFGPRDWSSIRSKGLLQRTGKSCRLRWVNKLRPNLKNGVKFSAEEERTVIELQAQFGNKWAKIATYLSGRTDNDVKNFWSSRQKRLARILQTSAPSSSNSPKNSKEAKAPAFHDVRSLEASKFSSSTEEESGTNSQSCSSPHIGDSEMIKMVPLPDLGQYPGLLAYEHSLFQFNYTPSDKNTLMEPQSHLSFPSIPQLQPDFPLPLESQDFITRLDHTFLDVFELAGGSALGTAQLPMAPSFLGPEIAKNGETSCAVMTPNSFIDDFPPIDMFDDIEPLPSPSEWS